MKHMRLLRLPTFVVALTLAAPVAAEAPCERASEVDASQHESRARVLFEEAIGIEASKPEEALHLLRCADLLAERPAIKLRIGTLAERLEQTSDALAAYREYLELAGEAAPDREDLLRRIDKLEERIATKQQARAAQDAPKPEEPIDLMLPGIILGGAGGRPHRRWDRLLGHREVSERHGPRARGRGLGHARSP